MLLDLFSKLLLMVGTWVGGRGARGKRRGEGMEFKDLRVWREAKDLVLKIYKVTEQFPKKETYGLADQLRRSTNSICANIAEGFNRYHAKDKIELERC